MSLLCSAAMTGYLKHSLFSSFLGLRTAFLFAIHACGSMYKLTYVNCNSWKVMSRCMILSNLKPEMGSARFLVWLLIFSNIFSNIFCMFEAWKISIIFLLNRRSTVISLTPPEISFASSNSSGVSLITIFSVFFYLTHMHNCAFAYTISLICCSINNLMYGVIFSI